MISKHNQLGTGPGQPINHCVNSAAAGHRFAAASASSAAPDTMYGVWKKTEACVSAFTNGCFQECNTLFAVLVFTSSPRRWHLHLLAFDETWVASGLTPSARRRRIAVRTTNTERQKTGMTRELKNNRSHRDALDTCRLSQAIANPNPPERNQ